MTQHAELIRRLETNAALMPSDAAVALEYKAAAEALKEQAREIEGLRKNAERYQWLRDCAALGTKHDPAVMIGGPADCCDFAFGPDLDAAIDEAMKGQP